MSKNALMLAGLVVGGFVVVKYVVPALQAPASGGQTVGGGTANQGTPPSASGGGDIWHDIFATAKSMFDSAGSYFQANSRTQ